MIIRGQKGGTADERMIAGFATASISPGFDLVRSKSIECDGRTADRCELSILAQPNFGIKFHFWERAKLQQTGYFHFSMCVKLLYCK